MKELRYTLICDGSSDVVLLPLLTWLLRENLVRCAIQPEWADLRRLPKPPRELSNKIKLSLELFPCDLLFVHRDAERESREARVAEIHKAVAESIKFVSMPPQVCVVPVRMQEAWRLFDEAALRRAGGNPHGKHPLPLPPLTKLEQLPNPKNDLHELLREASGLHGRRRRQLPVQTSARRVAEFIENFAPLRALSAFNALEADIQRVVNEQRWNLLPAE
jgi:hypothetical protein